MSALSLTVVRRVIFQEGVDALAAAGIPVWIDVRARVAHEKALIIDRGVTITGISAVILAARPASTDRRANRDVAAV
jgi:hypothetical protein